MNVASFRRLSCSLSMPYSGWFSSSCCYYSVNQLFLFVSAYSSATFLLMEDGLHLHYIDVKIFKHNACQQLHQRQESDQPIVACCTAFGLVLSISYSSRWHPIKHSMVSNTMLALLCNSCVQGSEILRASNHGPHWVQYLPVGHTVLFSC